MSAISLGGSCGLFTRGKGRGEGERDRANEGRGRTGERGEREGVRERERERERERGREGRQENFSLLRSHGGSVCVCACWSGDHAGKNALANCSRT